MYAEELIIYVFVTQSDLVLHKDMTSKCTDLR